MKETILGLVIGLIFSLLILNSIQKEDELVNQYCSGLSGYEYGQCQASIY